MRKPNFASGPCALPLPVLREIQNDIIEYCDSSESILEISHRSSHFARILESAKLNLRRFASIPDSHEILFLQGGASTQFSQVVMHFKSCGKAMDYIVSGTWSRKAFEECKRMGGNCNLVQEIDGKEKFDVTLWNWSSDTGFVYFCDNETVDGIEMPKCFIDLIPSRCPIICDMSSNFLTREVQFEKYGIIFAGAQKNLGIAGLTLVVIRKDVLNMKIDPNTPIMSKYSTFSSSDSLYNTPPTFAIYVCDLMVKWLIEEFHTLSRVELFHQETQRKLYDIIDNPENHFFNSIYYRSRINIVFRILDADGKFDLEAENKFAETNLLLNMKGHRSVGGLRVSLYNSVTMSDISQLFEYILNRN